jgi:hypothetical protein
MTEWELPPRIEREMGRFQLIETKRMAPTLNACAIRDCRDATSQQKFPLTRFRAGIAIQGIAEQSFSPLERKTNNGWRSAKVNPMTSGNSRW